jgi:hypothetical protein
MEFWTVAQTIWWILTREERRSLSNTSLKGTESSYKRVQLKAVREGGNFSARIAALATHIRNLEEEQGQVEDIKHKLKELDKGLILSWCREDLIDENLAELRDYVCPGTSLASFDSLYFNSEPKTISLLSFFRQKLRLSLH